MVEGRIRSGSDSEDTITELAGRDFEKKMTSTRPRGRRQRRADLIRYGNVLDRYIFLVSILSLVFFGGGHWFPLITSANEAGACISVHQFGLIRY